MRSNPALHHLPDESSWARREWKVSAARKKREFTTYSDLSWSVLRRVLAETDLD